MFAFLLAFTRFIHLLRLPSVSKLMNENALLYEQRDSIPWISISALTSLLLCSLYWFWFFEPSFSCFACNISNVRAWRRQTTIPMCLRTTRHWSTTLREKAPWQAASVPSLRAAPTVTKTTTTSTTGDHGSRNSPTCTTRAELAGAFEKQRPVFGTLMTQWSSLEWKRLRINAEGCQKNKKQTSPAHTTAGLYLSIMWAEPTEWQV